MAATSSTNVAGHLDRRHDQIRATFDEWKGLGSGDDDHRDVVAQYLRDSAIGDVATVGTDSVAIERRRAAPDAPTVLVLASHDPSRLVAAPSASAAPAIDDSLRGAGTGSLLGPLVAFIEGFTAACGATTTEPVNLQALSIGGSDSIGSLLGSIRTSDVDLVASTNAIAWAPHRPTLTVGARGRIELQITMTAPREVHDTAFGGAARNPLNRLVEILGRFRNDKGRIEIPGFYDRAVAPKRGMLSDIEGLEPEVWSSRLGFASPSGSIPAVERATLWPVISVLDVETNGGGNTIPSSASARVAVHLVPDQRPVEIETALRSWIQEQVPENLLVNVRILNSHRPYRSSPDDPAIAAHARALTKVVGQAPVAIPGGGKPGAGEAHYAIGAPVAFLGLCGPGQRWGSSDELFTPDLFDLGVEVAAELCQQLPRRTSIRVTP